jgi:hypothetical protein
MTKSSSSKPIRIITVQIKMTIPEDCECISQQDIVDYLNSKLLEDPEFFGGFMSENVIAVDRV